MPPISVVRRYTYPCKGVITGRGDNKPLKSTPCRAKGVLHLRISNCTLVRIHYVMSESIQWQFWLLAPLAVLRCGLLFAGGESMLGVGPTANGRSAQLHCGGRHVAEAAAAVTARRPCTAPHLAPLPELIDSRCRMWGTSGWYN